MLTTQILTDRQLVSWAIEHGWTYTHSNDQLRDPGGFLTTANRWENIGHAQRQQIIGQMEQAAKGGATC